MLRSQPQVRQTDRSVVVPQLQGVGGGVVDQGEGLQGDAARRPRFAGQLELGQHARAHGLTGVAVGPGGELQHRASGPQSVDLGLEILAEGLPEQAVEPGLVGADAAARVVEDHQVVAAVQALPARGEDLEHDAQVARGGGGAAGQRRADHGLFDVGLLVSDEGRRQLAVAVVVDREGHAEGQRGVAPAADSVAGDEALDHEVVGVGPEDPRGHELREVLEVLAEARCRQHVRNRPRGLPVLVEQAPGPLAQLTAVEDPGGELREPPHGAHATGGVGGRAVPSRLSGPEHVVRADAADALGEHRAQDLQRGLSAPPGHPLAQESGLDVPAHPPGGGARRERVGVVGRGPLGPGDELIAEDNAVLVHVLGEHDESVVLLGRDAPHRRGLEDESGVEGAVVRRPAQQPGGQVHGHGARGAPPPVGAGDIDRGQAGERTGLEGRAGGVVVQTAHEALGGGPGGPAGQEAGDELGRGQRQAGQVAGVGHRAVQGPEHLGVVGRQGLAERGVEGLAPVELLAPLLEGGQESGRGRRAQGPLGPGGHGPSGEDLALGLEDEAPDLIVLDAGHQLEDAVDQRLGE